MFNKLQKGVGEVLEFPPDVMGNGPKITLHGCRRVLVESYLEITVFSDTEIRLQTEEGEVCLTGKNFVLHTVLPTQLEIEGELHLLTFSEGGQG